MATTESEERTTERPVKGNNPAVRSVVFQVATANALIEFL